jgi:hypothetical protein
MKKFDIQHSGCNQFSTSNGFGGILSASVYFPFKTSKRMRTFSRVMESSFLRNLKIENKWTFSMSRLFLMFVLASATLFNGSANAQAVDISIGTGTFSGTGTSYPNPLQDYFEGSRQQFLFLASELKAAGMCEGSISALKMNILNTNYTGGAVPQVVAAYTIKIGTTSLASLPTTTWDSTLTQVYGPQNITPLVGINSFTFSSPFFWNGIDNLIIEVCDGDGSTATGTTWSRNPSVAETRNLPFNGSRVFIADDQGQLCSYVGTSNSGTRTTRPNLIFSWTAASNCIGTPSPGVATANSKLICRNFPFTLSLNAQTCGGGINYKWESAPTVDGPWTPELGASSVQATHLDSITSNTYYRCKITCSFSGGFSYTNVDSVFIDTRCLPMPIAGTTVGCDTVYFYDPGGPGGTTNFSSTTFPPGNYSNNDERVYTFKPNNPNSRIRVDFKAFSLISGDFLEIYDGEDLTAPLRGSFTSSPGLITSKAADGSITFRFTSNAFFNGLGWFALVYCYTPPPCSGTPPASTAVSSIFSTPTNKLCRGVSVRVYLSNEAAFDTLRNVTYQWQLSKDNSSFTNIPGATFLSYNTGILLDTINYFRCQITCNSAGGGTTTSSVTAVYIDTTCLAMPSKGSISVCGTTFYDNGSVGGFTFSSTAFPGNYKHNSKDTLTVYPSQANKKIQVAFSNFNVYNFNDTLKIFDGNNVLQPLVGAFNGVSATATGNYPGTITSTAADGSLTFVFRSDININRLGWVATLACVDVPPCDGVPPSPNIASNRNLICGGQFVNLSVSITPAATGYSFQWYDSIPGAASFNPIDGAINANYITPPLTQTTWFKVLITCDELGESSESQKKSITVESSPTIVSTSPGIACGTNSVTLSAVPSSGTLRWYDTAFNLLFSAGLGVQTFNATITQNTTYYVTARASGGAFCESNPVSILASKVDPPPVTISGFDSLCSGSSLQLEAVSTNANYTYVWTPTTNMVPANGVGTRITVAPTTTAVQASQKYVLTATDNELNSIFRTCVAKDSGNVIVFGKPSQVVITGPASSICQGSVDSLTTGATGLLSGTYPITWTPVANLFTNRTAATAYVNGAFATKLYVKPPAVTSLSYIATSTNQSFPECNTKDTIDLAIVLTQPLTVNASGSDSVCQGQNITLTAVPPANLLGSQYRWQRKISGGSWTDVQTTFDTANRVYIYAPANGDSVRAIIKNPNACQSSGIDTAISASKGIKVNSIPTATVSGPNSVCLNSTNNTYTATIPQTGVTTYTWSFKALNGTPTPNPSIASGQGTASLNVNAGSALGTSFTVALNYTVRGCAGAEATKISTLSQNFVGNVTITGNTSICQAVSDSLIADTTNGNSGGAATFKWEKNSGSGWVNTGITSKTYVSSSYVNGDQFRVIMTPSKLCASVDTSSIVSVTVKPTPTGSVSPTAVCANSTGNLITATVNQVGTPAHFWSLSGSGNITAGANNATVTVTAGASGSFTLKDSVVLNGCFGILQQAISINPTTPPTVSISGSNNGNDLCVGQSVSFTPTTNLAGTYQWQRKPAGGAWTNTVTTNTYNLSNLQLTNNDDSIRLIFTPNATACASSGTTAVISSALGLVVNASSTVGVTLSASPACVGAPIILTANPVNPGDNSTFEFTVNSSIVQNDTSRTYVFTPAGSFSATVKLTTDNACATNNVVTSPPLSVNTFLPGPTVSITAACNTIYSGSDQEIVMNSSTTPGSGASISNYSWKLNGTTNVGSNSSSFDTSFAGNYTLVVTNSNGCTDTSNTIVVSAAVTTPLPAGDYTIDGTNGCNTFSSLAKAVNYINLYGVTGTGGVRFNLGSGYTETAPSGGYEITASGTATNQIVIQKSGTNAPVITAALQTAGRVNDAVVKLIGADYVSIKNLTIQENAGNSVVNNMTEFGIAMLRASNTNGCQYDSIIGNTISLNKTNPNSFGIYSNNSHDKDVMTISATTVTTAPGAHSLNTFHSNSISNVNVGISLIGSAGSYDNFNDVGGNSSATGNTITNWGGLALTTVYGNSPANSTFGIYAGNQVNGNISYNSLTTTITSAIPAGFSIRGIWKNYSASPSVSMSDSITNNTLSVNINATSAAANYNFDLIRSEGMSTLNSNAILAINRNTIQDIAVNVTAAFGPTANLIFNSAMAFTVNMNNNTIRNYYSQAAAGSLNGIAFATATNALSVLNINNNVFGGSNVADSIRTASGNLILISSSGSAVGTKSVTGNSIQNIRASLTGQLTGINTSGGLNNTTVNNNTVQSLVSGTGNLTGIQFLAASASAGSGTLSNNSISALKCAGVAYGMLISTAPLSFTAAQNTISDVVSSGATSTVAGILTLGTMTFSGVAISGISNNNAAATTANVYGFQQQGGTMTITGSAISGLSNASTTTGSTSGILLATGAAVLSKNRIFDISNTSTASTGVVSGIFINTSTGSTISNNFISDIKAPSISNVDAVRGISMTGSTGTHNIHYNTIYLNASSSGANFGGSGVYHTSNSTSTAATLNLRNNIIINESVAKGTGRTVALRRSSNVTANYGVAGSNNNIYYAGPPSVNNLLYFDATNLSQTIAQLRTASTKDAASLAARSVFINSTTAPFNLRMSTTTNCSANGNGDNTGISLADDFDGDARAAGVTDIGADEFNGTGVAGRWGGVNTNWHDPVNWCEGQAPQAGTNITIPANGVANQPTISSATDTAFSNNLTIESGATLTISNPGVLKLFGNSLNDGTINSTGKILLSGNAEQTFPGNGTATLKDLEITNASAAGVTLNKSITITGSFRPATSGNGKLNLGNFDVVLASGPSGTAGVGTANSNSFGYTGTGRFVVERFISNGRKWRHLSIPVTTEATIRALWQLNGTTVANKGLWITSENPNATTLGFDAYTQGGATMKHFDAAAQTYVGLRRTDSASLLNNSNGFMVFVRGDRTSTTSSPNPNVNTTLSSRGQLLVGNQPATRLTGPVAGFVSVGNPYASAIDLRTFWTTNSNSTGLESTIKVWDPLLGSQFGGFVDLTYDGTNFKVAQDVGSTTYGGANSIQNYIQSGQAFFVKATNVGSASVQFTEAMKKSDTSRQVFRTIPGDDQILMGTLKVTDAGGNLIPQDGFRLNFDSRFSNEMDELDASKLMNPGENVSVKKGNKLYSIESRKLPHHKDTIFLAINNVRVKQYQLRMLSQNLAKNGLDAWLVDRFSGSRTLLNLEGETLYDFEVINQPESYDQGRFFVVFSQTPNANSKKEPEITLDAERVDNDVRLSWSYDNPGNEKFEKFSIQHSAKGDDFMAIGGINELISGNSLVLPAGSRLLTDDGSMNFRIALKMESGKLIYSNIATLVNETVGSGFEIFPNPVRGRDFNISLIAQPKGDYTVRINGQRGEVFGARTFKHIGGDAIWKITLPKMAGGVYQVVIDSPGKKPVTKSIILAAN